MKSIKRLNNGALGKRKMQGNLLVLLCMRFNSLLFWTIFQTTCMYTPFLATLRAIITLVLNHSGVVNRYLLVPSRWCSCYAGTTVRDLKLYQSLWIFFFRYYLNWHDVCLCVYLFNCGHIVQPMTMKLWHTIPNMII